MRTVCMFDLYLSYGTIPFHQHSLPDVSNGVCYTSGKIAYPHDNKYLLYHTGGRMDKPSQNRDPLHVQY